MNYTYRNVTDVFIGKLKELACDNKGAALAITLAFVMPVYLMVIGIYGVGEIVRNKIELQNAADAAAYSAAAVQADYLSRMATVNKAMAWTYVDLQKRSLDLAMASFTYQTFSQFQKDTNMVKQKNSPCHMHAPGINYCCGTVWAFLTTPITLLAGIGAGVPELAEEFNGQNVLNRCLLVQLPLVLWAEVNGKGAAVNGVKVAKYTISLVKMMSLLNRLQKEYSKKVKETAMQIAVANMVECKDDYIINIKVEDLPKLTMLPTAKDEKTFISWADPDLKETDPKKVFGPGTDEWIVRSKIPLGFSRVFKQTKTHLRAKWQWFWTRWVCIPTPFGPIHAPPATLPIGAYGKGKRDYKGKDVLIIKEGMPIGLAVSPAIPLTLQPGYFGKGGTIVVAIARKSANPLSVFSTFGMRSLTASGLASAFNPSVAGGKRPEYMCAISTARAGYKPYQKNKEKKMKNASYCIGYGIASGKKSWNLVETDWDAVMIPVRNAWDLCVGVGKAQAFTVEQGNILKEVMLDKDGWVNSKGKKIEKDKLPDWEKLEPPPGLEKDKDEKTKSKDEKNRLQWDKLRDYLGH